MDCVSADSLQQFALGTLAPDRLAEIEAHVDSCADCRAALVASARGEDADPVASDPPPMQIGRYQLERALGSGGMGTVYAARDPQLERRVAIKLLHAPATSDAEQLEQRARLLHEARAMARLSHPHVLPVFEAGESGAQIFLVMELAEQGTLADWLTANPARGNADQARILELFRGAGEGLAAAHAAGLVHRDFKPANVLLGQGSRPMVTDFGLARPLTKNLDLIESNEGKSSPASNQALQTSAAGSPAYMAPEQLRAEPIDPRADQFSFCVSLYEALYGERPFAGATIPALRESIEQEQLRPAPRPSRVPAGVRRLLVRGLHANREARFGSMPELLAALESARHPGRRRAALGVLTVMLAAGIAMAFFLVRQEARLNQMAEEKGQLDASIARVLAQLQQEKDPARLASLDAQLTSLSEGVGPDEAAEADELDRQLQLVLAKFGAGTYRVPPEFKAKLRAHIQRLLARKTLPEQWARKRLYWDRLTKPFRALGLPEEMAYLAWAESRFEPEAKSALGSLGLWQFMPDTGRRFGLVINEHEDERTDVDRSSEAAAHYLAQLMAELGSDSFLLAIAGYNAGEAQMRAALGALALEPNGFRKDKRDFWHLYLRKLLPEETREYVLEVLAAIVVGTNARAYGLEPGALGPPGK
jgi:serine/threonine protein kinase